ncbi:MAG: hydrolase [Woeseia sp.]|nr:hydrolase [Woeseia sp.]MBT8096637.1 hydrolase [Woeseia sp.]NNE59276.1 hydrolase [Woeseia sp.]NNL56103.1 hydrolase [Woeseia sp.]
MINSNPNERIVTGAFEPPRWLKNRHLQTLWPSLPWVHGPRPTLEHEWLELPDGDRTALEWFAEGGRQLDDRPLLVILHGLEGSAESPYCSHLMWAAAARGWRAVVLHFRDCGDYRNRLPRRYHAGETNDLRVFLERERARGHQGPLLATGYSLGGNVLLKYLGESGEDTPLVAAAAVSVPLDLHKSAAALQQGFATVYQAHLLRRMKASVRLKFNANTAAFDWTRAMAAKTFAEFDDAVTAPLHGFRGKDDYYDQCSAGGYLDRIERPTLIIHALDDPFMSPDIVPPADKIANCVTVEVSQHGGHVGFIEGGSPWRPRYYLPERIAKYFDSVKF